MTSAADAAAGLAAARAAPAHARQTTKQTRIARRPWVTSTALLLAPRRRPEPTASAPARAGAASARRRRRRRAWPRPEEPARRRVEHDPHDGERPPGGGRRQPRRLHVGGQGALGRQSSRAPPPRTTWSAQASGPAWTRAMPAAPSAATIRSASQPWTPSGPRTSLATTTSPGRRCPAVAPQNPATASASNGRCATERAAAAARAAPIPERTTSAPGARPRTAAHSRRNGVTTSRRAVTGTTARARRTRPARGPGRGGGTAGSRSRA